MRDGYEAFTLVWSGVTVEVAHQANWLNTSHWHIELRCTERLPVTTTGYRSIFVPQPSFADQGEIEAFVISLLDETAQSKDWRRHIEDRKQLKLF